MFNVQIHDDKMFNVQIHVVYDDNKFNVQIHDYKMFNVQIHVVYDDKMFHVQIHVVYDKALGSLKRLETIVLLWRYINEIELN